MLQVRARSFVRAHPHFVRVRAYTLDRCSTLDPHFAQVRAWHSNHRLMLPVRARPEPSLRSGSRLTPRKIGNASSSRPEPSQRFGFALDTVEGGLTLRVRARSFVRAPCEAAVSAQFAPDLLRGDPRYVQVRA